MVRAPASKSLGVWVLSVLLAIVFLAAGIPKLLGADPPWLQAAAMRGFPAWIRMVVGTVEVVAAVGLLVPAAAATAAGVLALLMLPATITQLVSGEPGAYVPAILFVLLVVVAWQRNPEAFRTAYRGVAQGRYPLLREGAIAGVIGATVIAVWFLIVDLIARQPLFTPATLGRALLAVLGPAPAGESAALYVAAYTVFHYAAFVVVGTLAALVIRTAKREPSVLLGFVILFVAFEIGFHALVALLQETTPLGLLAWYQVMAGNLLAALAMGAYLWKAEQPALGHGFAHAFERK